MKHIKIFGAKVLASLAFIGLFGTTENFFIQIAWTLGCLATILLCANYLEGATPTTEEDMI